jgi:hypothetical protein
MANGPTLPPQAYTRENLTAAFNWLQSQPESVKRLATTPDALVGLFMRAQRFGASSLEADAPVSSQHFMSDLKNLAEGLKQFEEPRRAPSAVSSSASVAGTRAEHHQATAYAAQQMSAQASSSAAAQSQTHARSQAAHATIQAQLHSSNSQMQSQTFSHSQAQFHSQAERQSHAPTQPPPPQETAAQDHSVGDGMIEGLLNERALVMIQEVKNQLNLSSNAEVINMMVTLGYKQLKSLLTS